MHCVLVLHSMYNVKMSAWVHCYTCCHMILAEVANFFWDLFPSSFQYWPSSTKFAKLAALSAFLCSKGHSRRLTPPPSNQPLHHERNREILSKNLTVLRIYPTHLILLMCLLLLHRPLFLFFANMIPF